MIVFSEDLYDFLVPGLFRALDVPEQYSQCFGKLIGKRETKIGVCKFKSEILHG